MYDMAQPNDAPGRCVKCSGSGVYRWGGSINGKARFEGPCHSCRGTGEQSARQIRTNEAYNRFKIARICEGWGGEDAA
jgi:DnaJ-class molecular chaperone